MEPNNIKYTKDDFYFEEKEGIGNGSNGSRVYRIQHKKNGKVNNIK